jgi:magnesium chelatase family protein
VLAAVRSAAVLGIDAYDICVEVDVAPGLPHWTIVGLPAGEVKESRERVVAALSNSGFDIPPRRITVSLSPGDSRKVGTGFDLPIAIGLLIAMGQLDGATASGRVFLGELGLDGAIRGVRGVLSVARHIAGLDAPALVIPPANVNEASLVRSLSLSAPATLRELVDALASGSLPAARTDAVAVAADDEADFADVVGQESAKRALEIAAAGAHACLLVGPPGAGKTMLARRLPSILPALTEEEALEVTAIHSVAGLLASSGACVTSRPFRAPHHSISSAGLVGGGGSPRPGEVSLAHNGVLFLDELLEFPRAALEALRQPLEDGRVTISRAALSVAFPARFSLIAAMNPCACGHAGDPRRVCVCSEVEIIRYRGKLSGPLADRIDMHVTLTPVAIESLGVLTHGESSRVIRSRVERARDVQRQRYASSASTRANASAARRLLWREVDHAAKAVLSSAAETLGLSARGFDRVLRVGRTIADLAQSERIEESHIAEAIRYRPR